MFVSLAPFSYFWALLINLTRCKDKSHFAKRKIF
nr:MAG TPA: hypothetical protein [Caudoviricetes sp.]